MRVSTANRLASATVFATTTAAAGYPGSNVLTAHRPFKPWRSTALGAHFALIDFGAPVTFDALAIVNTNAPTIFYQGDDAPTFNSGGGGSPNNSTALLTVTRNAWNERYHHVTLLSPAWTRRYLALGISAGTPLDAAAYWKVGGLWVGSLTESPDGIDWNYQPKPNRPRKDTTMAGGARSRVSLGNAFASITAKRIARIGTRPAGLADTLRAWLELERQWMASDYALVTIEDGDPSQAMVMRVLDDESWDVGYGLAEAGLVLEEVTGP